ncbi:Mandelate racemase/muconate lactonizing protein [Kribbella flavida DSM 17836]|uniref:Mandelate racemase/muconate lactonizing protein n=1 Tax=Kribbella flavida (strain DSM 17836 / JCM 10339 / NBRC 14399) TaxID=479435 RepID=D2PWR6_KRIFD|nr:mandelate racemase/muconate lactonizing enzyme family protein [Kribbella flavida]ADB33535.1 Mandelate racemase/muconate lactonizing protein [Kribbella flavida DSM 17836]
MTGDVVVTDVEVLILDGGADYGSTLADGERSGPRLTCLIKVSTDAGVTGYADVDSHPWLVKAAVEAPTHIPEFCAGLKDAVVGQSVSDRDALWNRMYQHSWYHGRRGVVLHAMSGIDIAIWDIAGRLSGQPVYDLLGGRRRDRVLAYASTLFRPTPDEMREAVKHYLDLGFRAIKFGWGPWGGDPDLSIELFAAARAEAGPEVLLMADGHITGDLAAVRELVHRLEDYDPFWVEEPFPADRPDDLAALGRHAPVRIASGEQLGGVAEFRELLREPGLSVVQPDLSRCGGFTAFRDIAALATGPGCLVVPHAWTSHLLTAAAIQAAAWVPSGGYLEYNVSSAPLARGLATGLRLTDGEVEVPAGPGLGVDVDLDLIDKYRVV